MRRYADYCGPLVSWVENDRANGRVARIYLRNMPQAWAYDMPHKACALASRNVRVAGPIQAAAGQIRGQESTAAEGKHIRMKQRRRTFTNCPWCKVPLDDCNCEVRYWTDKAAAVLAEYWSEKSKKQQGSAAPVSDKPDL